MRMLWVLIVLFIISACKKECEKLTDDTLFQFGAIQCEYWNIDTIDTKLYKRFDNEKGQPGAQAPVCYSKFVAQIHSNKIGDFELFQEKQGVYCFLKNGIIEYGKFTKQDTTNSMKFQSIEFISNRQILIAYVYNGDTVKSIKPCPN